MTFRPARRVAAGGVRCLQIKGAPRRAIRNILLHLRIVIHDGKMKQNATLSQRQTLTQTQTLSPQQLLTVKLLELPALELEERVKTELQDNPALDAAEPEAEGGEDVFDGGDGDADGGGADEDMSLADYRTEEDTPDYVLQASAGNARRRAEDIPFSDATSFYENLEAQLGELDIDDDVRRVALYIIGSLDDDGFLRKDLETILDELEIYGGVQTDMATIEAALAVVQSLDPAGLGARGLQECLLLQIGRKRDSQLKEAETRIIRDCYDDFTKKNWERIPSRLGLDRQLCEQALNEIKKLNPRPGIALGESIDRNNQTITPDFTVEAADDGRLTVSLNNYDVPELRLNRDFAAMLDTLANKKDKLTTEQRNALMFTKQKVDAAQGFIDAVNQRRATLLATMDAIVDWQRQFFADGDEASLRPMILKDIADRTGLDISTVSRVSNSKWVQTAYGVFPLKFFFNDGYVTKEGDELSVREIKSILRECIDHEDKSHPMTDEKLAGILKEKGYPIARRTVAKYREQLGIPTSKLRK